MPDELLLGSSEVIESAIGKFKTLERDQVKSGFRSMLLPFQRSYRKRHKMQSMQHYRQFQLRSSANGSREHRSTVSITEKSIPESSEKYGIKMASILTSGFGGDFRHRSYGLLCLYFGFVFLSAK